MNYRIKMIRNNKDGIYYIPQFKFLFWWFSFKFKDSIGIKEEIGFIEELKARKFIIEKQKKIKKINYDLIAYLYDV